MERKLRTISPDVRLQSTIHRQRHLIRKRILSPNNFQCSDFYSPIHSSLRNNKHRINKDKLQNRKNENNSYQVKTIDIRINRREPKTHECLDFDFSKLII